jgi:hypothetical protein
MLEFFDFLMFDLKYVFDDLDNSNDQAEAIVVSVAAVDSTIPETFWKLYTDHLPLEKITLMNVLAFYSGINEINVICDCDSEFKSICEYTNIQNNSFFAFGIESKNKTEYWEYSHNRIKQLYTELRG